MKIKRIYAENYKTYKLLDLNLEVSDDRPIILIGGGNGCGKTTLFDAIYHALYGLEIRDKKHFIELFNAGVLNEIGEPHNEKIMLTLDFSGMVLSQEIQYSLTRSYMLNEGRVVESVQLLFGANKYGYGSGTPPKEKEFNKEQINKIIAANLPAELSDYFLFDAMKTSELVKEEQINKLIEKNINSVMGFNKYGQMRKSAEALLSEKKGERLENEKQRQEYEGLVAQKNELEEAIAVDDKEYNKALSYANDFKEQYDKAKSGHNADELTKDKMRQLELSITNTIKSEKQYRSDAEILARDLETNVVYSKLASIIKAEVELMVQTKEHLAASRVNLLTEKQIETVTQYLVEIIEQKYGNTSRYNIKQLVEELIYRQEKENPADDRFAYLSDEELSIIDNLVKTSSVNQFITLNEQRERLNGEIDDMPRKREQLDEYQRALNGSDYTIIEMYEKNSQEITRLKETIADKNNELNRLTKKIATYDYEIPQVPDPQYDMLCRLPDFFKKLSSKLLRAKKSSIERMMRDQLNINLVAYAGVIGSVELSSPDNSDAISFKIFHKNGNEIYLSQLNAGAKQTVMQVLLKVLYTLGDYEPPVMIDTVMGVLDKESREVILESYFPDLAHQTILLSTDTEITTERDFEKIEAYVSKVFTLHRDKMNQCTTISEDYFGLTLNED